MTKDRCVGDWATSEKAPAKRKDARWFSAAWLAGSEVADVSNANRVILLKGEVRSVSGRKGSEGGRWRWSGNAKMKGRDSERWSQMSLSGWVTGAHAGKTR